MKENDQIKFLVTIFFILFIAYAWVLVRTVEKIQVLNERIQLHDEQIRILESQRN
jgi:cbb3-type cytochrome oxidase subunit 3